MEVLSAPNAIQNQTLDLVNTRGVILCLFLDIFSAIKQRTCIFGLANHWSTFLLRSRKANKLHNLQVFEAHHIQKQLRIMCKARYINLSVLALILVRCKCWRRNVMPDWYTSFAWSAVLSAIRLYASLQVLNEHVATLIQFMQHLYTDLGKRFTVRHMCFTTSFMLVQAANIVEHFQSDQNICKPNSSCQLETHRHISSRQCMCHVHGYYINCITILARLAKQTRKVQNLRTIKKHLTAK